MFPENKVVTFIPLQQQVETIFKDFAFHLINKAKNTKNFMQKLLVT